MKTAVVEGAELGAFDKYLMSAMEMVDTPDWTVRNERYLLGMLNEKGEIYRLMGVADLRNFVSVLNKLRALRYTDQIADGGDAEEGFDTIASAPHERSGDRPITRNQPLAEPHAGSGEH